MHLRDGLATTAAELSRDMCHDSGALTRVIDQLEQRGLIERRRALVDRRVVELTLTEAGLATVNALVPTVVGLLNGSLAGFTHDEAADFTRLLKKFINNISADSEAKELELLA
ncbi:MAG TPA: MarR family transcriptional regulator, partial [Alphaproteobacteria bacterium]|nr:MarR family transcriptional regulator [Alphaproteobacteria bacterium]